MQLWRRSRGDRAASRPRAEELLEGGLMGTIPTGFAGRGGGGGGGDGNSCSSELLACGSGGGGGGGDSPISCSEGSLITLGSFFTLERTRTGYLGDGVVGHCAAGSPASVVWTAVGFEPGLRTEVCFNPGEFFCGDLAGEDTECFRGGGGGDSSGKLQPKSSVEEAVEAVHITALGVRGRLVSSSIVCNSKHGGGGDGNSSTSFTIGEFPSSVLCGCGGSSVSRRESGVWVDISDMLLDNLVEFFLDALMGVEAFVGPVSFVVDVCCVKAE